jgi:serine phosphatase RsbU (regulator of sigma subunit)
MAMLKAALVILVQEHKPPDEIFRRLSAMVRSEQERRFFVTATLAVVNLAQGEMEITNAAHTPTYLVRQGKVSEIALTGHPLGALGDVYGRQTVGLQDGDIVVWLSDGLVEAADDSGKPFGYDRLEQALQGSSVSAAEVRDRLLAAEEAFTGGKPAEDDQTLVAMRYSVAGTGDAAPIPE